MAELDAALAELARLRAGDEPILSLYLDVRWTDEQQRERVRLFVQEAVRRTLARYPEGAPGREALQRTLSRMREWVAGLTGQAREADRQGVALFACESMGLWVELGFAAPLENALSTDAVPHLKPLVRLAGETMPVLVVAPAPEGADVFSVRLGEIEVEERVRQPLPRRGEPSFEPGAARPVAGEGPTSRYERSDKNQRHGESVARRNRRAAVAELQALFDRRPESAVVLVGPARALAAFERDLPERIAARVAARVRRPRGWEAGDGTRRAAVLAAAAEGAREAARVRAGHLPDVVVGEALRGGIAVVGPEDVVLALNEKRVQVLVLDEQFRRAGWRCENCDALGASAEAAEACPWCGGELHVVRDLGEALVARTLAVGGSVEVVAGDRRLRGYRGVGALLRQTAPTGLRGASPPWPTAPGASRP
ncbi:MAG TPA: hypothetical protein VFL83_19095 [Anaeromyxobacter sp.]|nr:hypothetical protein [Anaeromyxobacter sp.]